MKKNTIAARALSILLALCMMIALVPTALAKNDTPKQNAISLHVLTPHNISAFEGSYPGYTTQIDVFDGRDVRTISRTSDVKTDVNFCMYRWGSLLDKNSNFIPLHSSKYIAIEYYYKSSDENPVLVGNRMKWMQGRITPWDNPASIIEFGWSTNLYSENGMVANKWDTLVIPLAANESIASMLRSSYKNAYHLHQMKLFPLERDMGKDDVLYIADITLQSNHPSTEMEISERTLSFYNNEDDLDSGKPLTTLKEKDFGSVTIPEFTGTAPENSAFECWISDFDLREYRPGATYFLLAGENISFYPKFVYKFDFLSYEGAYISGYTDGTFKPQGNITRAEAIKILASIVNPQNKVLGECTFADVPADAWYRNHVATLEAMKALEFFGESLEPDKEITRGELVEIIHGISDTELASLRLTYVSDVKSTARCYTAVMYAIAAGIITGYEDGTFRPDNKITRAEAVTAINRMIGRTLNAGATANKFSDVGDHWALPQVIAASTTKSEGLWTASKVEKEYVLTGSSAKDYITALHTQAKSLSGEAIRRGIDTISEQMKKDILNTPNTEEFYGPFTKAYYISEKNGNDDNDGTSPEKAVKTLAGLAKKVRFPKKGTAFLFERGGVYRGTIGVTPGVIYGSYGEGDKPVLSGSLKNYADASLWKQTDVKNVYELTDKLVNVGIVVFDHASNAHGNYDGLYGKNRVYGKNISHYSGLTKDLEFFSCDDTLYLYSESGNPGSRFNSIEIGTRVDVFDGTGNNIVIDNIHVKHTGSHGIGLGGTVQNLTVTNCEFSWLGGSLLGDYGMTTTQYGNAVEVYAQTKGYYVRNNWMYQIYDTAVTHQGKCLQMYDIKYSGNLMEYCHWGIECWITPEGTGYKTVLKDYLAEYNVLRNGGYGWGSIVTNRQDSARLYSFSTVKAENSDLYAKYNIIDRCSGYLLDIDSQSKELFDCNIYVQDEGRVLGGLKGKHSITKLDAPELIATKLKDQNLIFVFIPQY